MAAMSVNTVMDVDRCLNPVAHMLPFTPSSLTVMDETQVEAKKEKVKKLPLRLSYSTRRCPKAAAPRRIAGVYSGSWLKTKAPRPARRASSALMASSGAAWLHLCHHLVMEKKIVSFLKQISDTKSSDFSKRELSHRLQIQIVASFSKLWQPLNITSVWIRVSCGGRRALWCVHVRCHRKLLKR